MSKYKVLDKEFETFEEVIKWAWDEHKIETDPDADVSKMTEETKLQACVELVEILQGGHEWDR